MKSKLNSKNSSHKLGALPSDVYRVYGASLILDYARHNPNCIRAFEAFDAISLQKIFKDSGVTMPKVPFHHRASEPQTLSDQTAERNFCAWVEHKTFTEASLIKDIKSGGVVSLAILDHVTDPRNLGAIIRSAAFFGIHHVVISSKRASPITDVGVQAARGGLMSVNVYIVTNLSRCIKEIKEHGFWIYGCDASSPSVDLLEKDIKKSQGSLRAGVVFGAEGEGLSRLLKERCDHLIAIPGDQGKMESLNVSVAAAIVFRVIYTARLE